MTDLLVNETECKNFLEFLLEDVGNDEVYLLFLFARKKYNPIVKDEYNLARDFIKEKDIDEFIRKIKRMSLIENNYIDFKTNVVYPVDSMVFYIDLNPKSLLKAWNHFSKEMNDILYNSLLNDENIKQIKTIKKKLMRSIHKSNSRKLYKIIDIDVIDEEVLNACLEAIKQDYEWITRTRGGYHVIVENSKVHGKWIYENIVKDQKENPESIFKEVEIKNEGMTPLVGTLQGGKEVKKWG